MDKVVSRICPLDLMMKYVQFQVKVSHCDRRGIYLYVINLKSNGPFERKENGRRENN